MLFKVVFKTLISKATLNILVIENLLPLSAWCPLKGHTYFKKPAAKSCRFVKYA